MPARINKRHSDMVRAKIQASALIHRLQSCAMGEIDLTQDAEAIVKAAKEVGVEPGLVVVDTMSQTFSGEENSANEVAAYLRELGIQFRAMWYAAVLLIHHSGHQATERPRGSSAIRSNVDFMFGVFRDDKEMLARVECHKQKDGEMFPELSFGLDSINVGFDEDGDTLSSLVASYIASEVEVAQRMASEAANGRGGRNQLIVSLASTCVTEKELRAAFYEDLAETDPEAKRKAYNRAKHWAMNNHFFEIVDGYIVRKGADK